MSHRRASSCFKDYILISWTRPFLVAVELHEEGSYAGGASEGGNREMTIVLRPGTAADAPACGSICYEAFKAIGTEHNFPPDFPSPEVASGLLSMKEYMAVLDAIVRRSEVTLRADFVEEVGE